MTSNGYSLPGKVQLALRIWWLAASTRLSLRRRTLPTVIADLGDHDVSPKPLPVHPVHLGVNVARALTLGRFEARCLTKCLVHYRLLREAGYRPEIVIGLPTEAKTKDAHSWLEIDGHDIGPPPGRADHLELARYGG